MCRPHLRGTHIDDFEYTGREDLIHLLAHEFGHALGVEHNANAASIMYRLNSSSSSSLTVKDVVDARVAPRPLK